MKGTHFDKSEALPEGWVSPGYSPSEEHVGRDFCSQKCHDTAWAAWKKTVDKTIEEFTEQQLDAAMAAGGMKHAD